MSERKDSAEGRIPATRCVVYPSKRYAVICLGLLGVLGFLFFLGLKHSPATPLWAKIAMDVLIGTAALASLHALFTHRAAFVADESGLTCYRLLYPLIEWPDIVQAELLPKVTTTNYRGVPQRNFTLERWRLIRLTIKNASHYLAKVPTRLRPIVASPDGNPDHTTLTIEYAGMAGSSRDLFETIQYYIRPKS